MGGNLLLNSKIQNLNVAKVFEISKVEIFQSTRFVRVHLATVKLWSQLIWIESASMWIKSRYYFRDY